MAEGTVRSHSGRALGGFRHIGYGVYRGDSAHDPREPMVAALLQGARQPFAPDGGFRIAPASVQRLNPHARFVDALLDAVVGIPCQVGRCCKDLQRLFGLPQIRQYQRVGEGDIRVFGNPRLAALLRVLAGGFGVRAVAREAQVLGDVAQKPCFVLGRVSLRFR
jgi:hypothetical protein